MHYSLHISTLFVILSFENFLDKQFEFQFRLELDRFNSWSANDKKPQNKPNSYFNKIQIWDSLGVLFDCSDGTHKKFWVQDSE